MNEGKNESLTTVIFLLAAFTALSIGLLTRSSLAIPRGNGKLLGEVIFFLGMALFTWALFYLREGFYGKVKPVSDRLVTNGPYRWVRHPVYLSMIITLLGIVVALRSLWGIFGIFIFFTPAIVWRARLEERALKDRFGGEWEEYTRRTSLRRRKR